MFTLTLLISALLSFQTSTASTAINTKDLLVQQKWQLNKQVFSSHDVTGTDSNTVAGNKNDYIEFRSDGTALISYKGNKDILEYKIVNDNVLSFGIHSYTITQLNNHTLHLYQNEEEPNGDYNREWLELQK